MPKLTLIKHAKPQMDESLPSAKWRLSDDGRAQAAVLATRLNSRPIDQLITSTEPKAAETGQIIADALGVSISSAPDLHEHDRSNVPVLPTREFISMMALFFKQPNRLVLGRETATDAKARITKSIAAVLDAQPGKSLAIVTHGTVLALFAAQYLKQDPFEIWRRMGLPSFVTLDWPSGNIVEIVDRV